MKIKTSDLIGPALDWAVAKCEYDDLAAANIQWPQYAKHYPTISPSTIWAQGGPIIEREGIDTHKIKRHDYGRYEYNDERAAKPGAIVEARPLLVGPGRWVLLPNKKGPNDGKWIARMSTKTGVFGWSPDDFMSDTPLIAAMRCHVANKLGDVVDIPDTLI